MYLGRWRRRGRAEAAVAEPSAGTISGLLHLVQGLSGLGVRPRGGLWIVTADSQKVVAGDGVTGLRQSPLWGLGKVVALEHSEYDCRCVDVRPGEAAAVAEQLAGELLSSTGETQVACRRTRRYEPPAAFGLRDR